MITKTKKNEKKPTYEILRGAALQSVEVSLCAEERMGYYDEARRLAGVVANKRGELSYELKRFKEDQKPDKERVKELFEYVDNRMLEADERMPKYDDARDLEAKLKSAKESFEAEQVEHEQLHIHPTEIKRLDLQERCDDGVERRDILCEHRRKNGTKILEVVRCDSGVVIFTRDMTQEELERDLPFDGPVAEAEMALDPIRVDHVEPEPEPEMVESGWDHLDDLIPQAMEVLKETERASAFILQRKLGIGYSDGSLLIELMEHKGLIGPFVDGEGRALLFLEDDTGDHDAGPLPELSEIKGDSEASELIEIDGEPVEASMAPDAELIEQAIVLIKKSGKCSTSSLQRGLRIGYNRADALLTRLEELGHVGKIKGDGSPRDILLDGEEVEA